MTPKRVVVIDDEGDIRDVAKVSLEMVGGWQALTASSGSEGLAKARAEQPDAILLDVMMPDMDGPATFSRLQADAAIRQIPVSFLTAKVQANDRRRFAELGVMGVMGVIAKPFDPLSLPRDMAEVVGWSQ